MADALNTALRDGLRADPSVLLLGEDIGVLGGVFRVTTGLRDEFGEERVVDTPVSEVGVVGAAVGLALAGMRPVCELQFDAFSYPALDQIVCHLSRYRWRTGGAVSMPVTVRIPYGGGVRAAELHSESPEAYFVHTPGVKVFVPSSPTTAARLMAAALQDPDPVVLLEPKRLYGRKDEPGGRDRTWSETGSGSRIPTARLLRTGSDVTVVAYGAMVEVAVAAADEVADHIGCEIIDLLALSPLDLDPVLTSVSRTGRLVVVHEAPGTAGVGAEIVAGVVERGFADLRAPAERVTGYDVPYPYWSLETHHLPSRERVVRALHRVVEGQAHAHL